MERLASPATSKKNGVYIGYDGRPFAIPRGSEVEETMVVRLEAALRARQRCIAGFKSGRDFGTPGLEYGLLGEGSFKSGEEGLGELGHFILTGKKSPRMCPSWLWELSWGSQQLPSAWRGILILFPLFGPGLVF